MRVGRDDEGGIGGSYGITGARGRRRRRKEEGRGGEKARRRMSGRRKMM